MSEFKVVTFYYQIECIVEKVAYDNPTVQKAILKIMRSWRGLKIK